jgi:hypothetical protein
MKAVLALIAVVVVSAPAFARDSSHLVCSGFMSSKAGPENYGVSIQLDEGRAADGTSRVEMLSSVWAGDLYQGQRLNKNDGFGQMGIIVMADKTALKNVYYKGAYDLLQDSKTGKFSLQLRGLMNLEPASPHQMYETIKTTLKCTDISN